MPDWLEFVLMVLLVCALVFMAIPMPILIASRITAQNECRAAGYGNVVRFAGERWCIGIVDGEGVIQRLEEIRGEAE